MIRGFIWVGAGALIVGAGSGCAGRTAGVSAASLPPAPTAIAEQPVALMTPTGTIAGTLEVPARAFPVPVVLIIAGSGPTDRDGNSRALPGSNNSLKLLASGLAERGIASVRYDKRGVGGSAGAAGREEDMRFTHFIDDATGWVRQLGADARFSSVTVAGHSEGSLIGMAAAREGGADAYVSLEGAGRKPRAVIVEQLTGQLPAEAIAQADMIMAVMEAGTLPDSTYRTVPILNSLFRPGVRPYLVSWFRYDPAAEIAKLSVPTMIVQGTTDIQVGRKDAGVLAAARPAAKLVVIEGMNHVLKIAPPGRAAQGAAYSDPSIPVVPQLLDEVAAFVKSVKARRRATSTPPQTVVVADPWFGADKLKHFFIAGFVESVAFAGLEAAGADRRVARSAAIAGTAATAIGREVYDYRSKGVFSFRDIVWGAFGAGAALMVLQRTQ